jgi:hypothetical protein
LEELMKNKIVVPASLQKPLDAARSSYTRSHNEARNALAKMMGFAQICFNNWEEFVDYCDLSLIKVRPGAADNDYIRVVRAVIGKPQLSASGIVEAWVSSDKVASRYSKVLLYADKAHGITTEDEFKTWLERSDEVGGGGTITEAYDRAVAWERSLTSNGNDDDDFDDEPVFDTRFERGLEFLNAKANAVVTGKATKNDGHRLKVNLKKKGAPKPGLHRLLVQVKDDGTVEYVGFQDPANDAGAEKAIRNILPNPQSLKASFPVLSALLRATKCLKPSKSNEQVIQVQNKIDGFTALLCSGAPNIGPVIIVTGDQKVSDFPSGLTTLDQTTTDSIRMLGAGLKFSDWSLGKVDGGHCYKITPQFGMTVEELLEYIDESRAKPFEIPEGAYDTEEYCYVPLDHINSTAKLQSIALSAGVSSTISSESPSDFAAELLSLFTNKQKMVVASVRSSELRIETTKGKQIGETVIKAPQAKDIKTPLFTKDVVAALKLFQGLGEIDDLELSFSSSGVQFSVGILGLNWKVLIPARKGTEYDITAYSA